MDGTILDTLGDLTDSTNYALRKNGFPELTLDYVRTIVGNGLYMEAKRATPEGTDEETVMAVYNDLFTYYKDHNEIKTRPYDGIVNVIGKARGSKKGNNILISKVKELGGIDYSMPLCVGYTGLSDELLQKYLEDSRDLYDGDISEIKKISVGATIGTYAGPGAIAVAFFPKGI